MSPIQSGGSPRARAAPALLLGPAVQRLRFIGALVDVDAAQRLERAAAAAGAVGLVLGGPDPGVGRLYDGLPHALARDPHLRVHLYGKQMRPGRKVGHVNAYGEDLEDCLERARHAAAWFRGDLGDESE